MEKIETKDLFLAKASQKDLKDIYKNFWSQKETAKYMLWKPCENLQEAQVALDNIIKFQKDIYAYFVYEKKTKQAIGIAGMKEIAPGVFEDAGIGLGLQFVGKGYGKQILTALVDLCKNKLHASKIVCSCFKENVASAKLQQSCGFQYTHSEKQVRKWDGKEYISDYYELNLKS